MNLAASSRSAITIPDDRPVLVNAPLRPGFDRDELSRYGDATWDLGPAVFRENTRRSDTSVDFGSVRDPIIADAIREYVYA